MKLRRIILFSVFFVVSIGVRLPAQEQKLGIFDQANSLYKNGQFDKAMTLYQQISEKNAVVFYNLGNCAYQLKQYGNALLFWRRAEKLWGVLSRQELVENISLLKEHLKGVDAEEIQKPEKSTIVMMRIKMLILSWIRFAPLFMLQLIFLFLWFFLFFYLRFLYKRRRKWVILTLFSLAVLFGILLAMRYNFDTKRYGVVVAKQTDLLSGPGKTFTVLQQLSEAQEVLVKKESSGYYKIKVNSQVGWVEQEKIGII